MKQLLNLSLFLLLALTTAFNAAGSSGASVRYNGINYTFIYSGYGASAVGEYAIVDYNSSFSGAANIASSVSYQYTYVSGYDSQGSPISTTRNLTAPVTRIRDKAFYYCTGLTSVTIPNSITKIESDAFNYCNNLTSVHISDLAAWCNIDFVNYSSQPLRYAHHLFLNGVEIKDLVIPNSVTTIGDYAFNDWRSLTSVTIPNSVTSIGERAFSGCSSLTRLTIGNSVTTIPYDCFYGCSSLTSVTIPNSVTTIGDYAFNYCSSLTSVIIPNSVTTIGTEAFGRCSSLTSVHISDLAAWCRIDFDWVLSNPLYYAHHLFLNETEIKDLVIPNSVTTIGDLAFINCSSLTSVTIPNSVTAIGESAFSGCSSLTSVTIPNSVTSIGYVAFQDCSGLTNVTIPNSVTTIGDYAFNYCSSLMSVTCLAATPPGASSNTFSNYSATLYVPAGSLYEYQTTSPWKNFYNIQPIGQEYSISLNETSAVIEKGDYIQLRATVTPDDDYAPTVTWSSSNTSVATVDEWGIVTAVGAGNAVITAHAGNASATCSIKVVEHTVTLDQSSATIPLYSTLQLNATVTPPDGYEPTVEWSSSRPGIATVTQDGLVKGYMTGTVTITARAGQSTATCVVTVIPIYATGIALNTYQEDMEVGEVTRIIAYVAPNDVTNSEVSWSVTGNDVISASWNGSGNECIVIAEKAGTATVTATTTDGTNLSATCIIRVSGNEPVYIPVESISLNKSSLTMNVSSTRHLVATVLPANATNRTVTWTSSNSNVVSVDEDGVVTANKSGTATITATTNGFNIDGIHLRVRCQVTVVASGGDDDLLLGDVNGDGYINIADVTALIRYLLSHNATGIELDNADVNGDGYINIADVTTLINRLLKGHW